TLGVRDLNNQPNYDQADTVQIARAFTGWSYDYSKATPVFNDYDHDYTTDYPERGPKVIYKTKGGFGVSGRNYAPTTADEGAAEIGSVIDIIFQHTDSTGHNTVARYITGKLISYFAHPNPSTAYIDSIVSASNFASTWDLSAVLRAIFVSDEFYA